MEFIHSGGVAGIDSALRQMLADDFMEYFDHGYFQHHIPADLQPTPHPQRPERNRTRVQEPLRAGEIIDGIISGARSRQQQREQEEADRAIAELQEQGYHVDTETGEVTETNKVPAHTVPEPAARQSEAPTEQDRADFGAWAQERQEHVWKERPPQPKDFGIKDDSRQAASEPEDNAAALETKTGSEEAAGHTADTSSNIQQEPLLTLYDLFGFSAEERSQITLNDTTSQSRKMYLTNRHRQGRNSYLQLPHLLRCRLPSKRRNRNLLPTPTMLCMQNWTGTAILR